MKKIIGLIALATVTCIQSAQSLGWYEDQELNHLILRDLVFSSQKKTLLPSEQQKRLFLIAEKYKERSKKDEITFSEFHEHLYQQAEQELQRLQEQQHLGPWEKVTTYVKKKTTSLVTKIILWRMKKRLERDIEKFMTAMLQNNQIEELMRKAEGRLEEENNNVDAVDLDLLQDLIPSP